jgi:hypothetical protein
MLLDAAILSILVGLLAGGRLGRLKDIDLKAPWLFIAAAAVSLGVRITGAAGLPVTRTVGPWLFAGSYLALAVALWLNRHLRPLWVVAVGVFLNFLVIAANGGAMPVDRNLALRSGNQFLLRLLDSPEYTVHKPLTPATRLAPLADVLPLPMLYPRPRFFCPGSAGDVFVTVGACGALLVGLGAFGLGKKVPETGARA